MDQPEIILYSRSGCQLCDEAYALIRHYGPEPTVVDIDRDADLRQEYGDCVPVVKIDGRVRFRGRVNEVLLKRLLEGGK